MEREKGTRRECEGERRRARERDEKNEGILCTKCMATVLILTSFLVYFGCGFFSFEIVGI